MFSLSTLICAGAGNTDIGFPLPCSLTVFSLTVLPKTVLDRAQVILSYLSESPTREIFPGARAVTIKACE